MTEQSKDFEDVRGVIKVFNCRFVEIEGNPKFNIGEIVSCAMGNSRRRSSIKSIPVCAVTGIRFSTEYKEWIYDLFFLCRVDFSINCPILDLKEGRRLAEDLPGEHIDRPENMVYSIALEKLNLFKKTMQFVWRSPGAHSPIPLS